MKKMKLRMVAVVLAAALVFSAASVGAVALTFSVAGKLSGTAGVTPGQASVINVNSVEDVATLFEEQPELFAEPQTAEAPTYAAPADPVIYPTVILPGISQSISYLADREGNPAVDAQGNELSGGLIIIDQSKVAPTLVNRLLIPISRSLIWQDDVGLSEGVYNTIKDLFYVQASDKNGNPVNNLKTVSYNTSVAGMSQDDRDYFYRMIPMQSIVDEVGEDNLYLYAFPLIGDPMESAKGLDKYIQMVKQQKGVDKVNIATISLGGTIFTAYLENKKGSGYPDINRVINVVSCLQGTDIMGDFYLRQWNLEDEFFFHEYIPAILKANEDYETLGHVINILLKIFPKKVVYAILTAAISGLLDNMMLNCPQFWAMLPTDRFDDCKAKYSYIWDDPSYAQLAAKIDKFHKAAVNLKANLTALNNRGVIVDNVAGFGLSYFCYDYNFFGAMASSKVTNSDGIIDIDGTTLGATYAPAGQVLPDEVLNRPDAIISPDGSVDLSTALFPNNTWLFQGQHHEVGRNDVVIKLIGKLITGQIKSTADMADEFPQFNGTRNTRNLTRWYLGDAENVLNATDQAQYDQADLDELQDAYDECQAMLSNTICEPSTAEAATQRLLNALCRVGVRSEEDHTTDEVLEAISKFLDDTLYSIFGAGGFSDIVTTGPFPNGIAS